MCGIFGFVGRPRPTKNLKDFSKFMSELAEYTSSRGKDATGIAAMTINKEKPHKFRVWKGPWPARIAVKSPKMMSALERAHLCIGHVRAATHGDATNPKNNHPFWGERYSVVHNGVIHNYNSMMRTLKWEPKGDCDSESILAVYEKTRTPMSAYDYMISHFNGAWAVAVLDAPNKKVYLGRAKNPLTLAWSKKWQIYVFASVKDHIEKAAKDAKVNPDFEFEDVPEQKGLISLTMERGSAPTKTLLPYVSNKTADTSGPGWESQSGKGRGGACQLPQEDGAKKTCSSVNNALVKLGQTKEPDVTPLASESGRRMFSSVMFPETLGV